MFNTRMIIKEMHY